MSATAAARRTYVIFAEDPGAVNCLAPLVEEMTARGLRVSLLASGLATELFNERGLDPRPVDSAAEAVDALQREELIWLVIGTSENPDSYAFSMIAMARRLGVPSAAVIDFGANAEHRFRGRSGQALAHAPDYVLVPDSWAAGEFMALGLPAERVVIVGHPHQDYLIDVAARLRTAGRDAIRRRVLPDDSVERTVLVFAAELSTGLGPDQYRRSSEYTLHGRGGVNGRTEIVIEELLDAVASLEPERRPYMVLRLHPKQSAGDLVAYRSAFDYVSVGGEVLELLFGADLVIGMSSMLLTEAQVLGIPVISLLPREAERDWLPIVRTGAIPSATERTAFRHLLARTLGECRQRTSGGSVRSAPPARTRSVERILRFLGANPGTDRRRADLEAG